MCQTPGYTTGTTMYSFSLICSNFCVSCSKYLDSLHCTLIITTLSKMFWKFDMEKTINCHGKIATFYNCFSIILCISNEYWSSYLVNVQIALIQASWANKIISNNWSSELDRHSKIN
ncbi:hypothetical protein B566_EDAN015370 [Ephemera danica]|nr:hypothetical protein B566_EDAN015370 [Ephemera danica]